MPRDTWSFGFAEAEITPTKSIHMAGFGRERYAGGTIAPLVGQAFAMRAADGQTAMILAADVVGFDPMTYRVIQSRLQARHGILPGHVLLAPSHTHWGPTLIYRINFVCGAPSLHYTLWLENKLLELADAAMADLTAGTLEYHDCHTRIGHNRRLFDPQTGAVAWAPNPQGHYDTHTPVLAVSRSTHREVRQLLLVSHSCHPTGTGQIDQWSPDYPGAMRERLAGMTDQGTRAIFLMGPGADAKPTFTDPKTGTLQFTCSPEGARQAGYQLADGVLEAMARRQGVFIPPGFSSASATADLPLTRWKTQEELRALLVEPQPARPADAAYARQVLNYPDTRTHHRYTINGWKLGDKLTLLGMPDEVCSPWGPRARALAKTDHAMLLGYVNHIECYIPDEQIRREGGYEGDFSHRAFLMPGPFAAGVDQAIEACIIQTIRGLEG